MQSLGCRLKTWSICLPIVISLSMFLLSSNAAMLPFLEQPHEGKVPVIFAFGDSIIDSGNNNNLLTLFRSNFPPYGRNFEDQRSTGRFSNGRILTDFLVEELGINKYLPAYLDPSLEETDLITGVNFASSGSGFDPLTPQIAFARSMDQQLKMLREYIAKVIGILGLEGANFIMNNSISFVISSSNDLANNYFSTPFRRIFYDFDSYSDLMISFVTTFLKNLYKRGVLKIGVHNLPHIGYLPLRRTLAGGLTRESVKENNELAQLHNSKLQAELESLRSQFPNAKLVYIDIYSILLDLIVNHSDYGFEVADRGCCGSGLVEAGVLCNSFSLVTCDVNKYVFWDSLHFTERSYHIIARQILHNYFSFFF